MSQIFEITVDEVSDVIRKHVQYKYVDESKLSKVDEYFDLIDKEIIINKALHHSAYNQQMAKMFFEIERQLIEKKILNTPAYYDC